MRSIIFLDTESVSNQGGKYWEAVENRNDLIQLSFVDMFDDKFDITIRPFKTYHETNGWYLDHGLTWDILKDRPELDELYGLIKNQLEGKTIVTHNVEFDKNLIEQSLKNYGLPMIEAEWICTKTIYAQRFGLTNRKYSSMERLMKQMGLYDKEKAHNSLEDAKMLKSLFMSYLRKNYLEV